MPSQLAWLDSSRADQQRMRELIGMFGDQESRDDLGIGQVRDAFGDLRPPADRPRDAPSAPDREPGRHPAERSPDGLPRPRREKPERRRRIRAYVDPCSAS
ncbi:DUF6361 family protein [Actinoplanes couchii]|uniref:DUF6361 family protein n=1 Tax=Actinoplanes couchii TaxID=403638 RepID=UPI0035A24161